MATALVEGATSDMLGDPDWALNIELCDIVNDDPQQAKDVIKAVKKRLGNKNPKVQTLTLVLLESLMKNCGDNIQLQVIQRGVLHDMVKLVKKKLNLEIRDKLLVLLHEWQETFGGPQGKFPQYYDACQDLIRTGVKFPQNLDKSSAILETHQDQPISSQSRSSSPNHGAEVVEEPLASSLSGLSLLDIQKARSIMDVLTEMLNALDPKNKEGVKDEIIMDLVEQCSFNKQQAMQLVVTTSDEELLGQALALNDDLQHVLGKHDSIASGSYAPSEEINVPAPSPVNINHEEDEAEDDVEQLFRRSSRVHARSEEKASVSKRNHSTTHPPLIPQPSDLAKVNTSLSKPMHIADLLNGDGDESLSSNTPSDPSTEFSPIFQQATPNPFNTQSISQGISARAEPYPSSSELQEQNYSHTNGILPSSYTNKAQQNGDKQCLQTQGQSIFSNEDDKPARSSTVERKSDLRYDSEPHNLKAQTHKIHGNPPPAPQIENSHKGPPLPGKIAMPALPPPPARYTERQQFFQQQQALASVQLNKGFSEAGNNDLTGNMHNLSL